MQSLRRGAYPALAMQALRGNRGEARVAAGKLHSSRCQGMVLEMSNVNRIAWIVTTGICLAATARTLPGGLHFGVAAQCGLTAVAALISLAPWEPPSPSNRKDGS